MSVHNVAQRIAETHTAMKNCQKSGNTQWEGIWARMLVWIEHEWLPRGSGVDNGCEIVSVTSDCIMLQVDFHHMDEHGYYDGWTSHPVTIRSEFSGLHILIKGRDRNNIKDYLADLLYTALTYNIPAHLWDEKIKELKNVQ